MLFVIYRKPWQELILVMFVLVTVANSWTFGTNWRNNNISGRLRMLPKSADIDSEVWRITNDEWNRQAQGLNLIASENYMASSVQSPLSSCFSNKYSEGRPGKRYYGGSRYVDELELLCEKRALALFQLDASSWHVNVQPYSGTPANLGVFTGLLKPGDKIMGLDLPSGGHLSHGYKTKSRNISASSIFFNTQMYGIDPSTGLVDYERLVSSAVEFRPKLIIAGASAYSRDWDYAIMRKIADSVQAYLMADISHICGFVATGLANNPFPYCDVVTTTTHKSLRGPRSGLVFCKKILAKQIDEGIFPGIQGGPHNNQIAALSVALKEAATPEFRSYIQRVQRNARVLSDALSRKGFDICTGGTDNHMLLWSLKRLNISGQLLETVLEHCDVFVNRNAIFGDISPMRPSGVRLGTPAVTTRGANEQDMMIIADILEDVANLAIEITNRIDHSSHDPRNVFYQYAASEEAHANEIRNRVHKLTSSFIKPACGYLGID